MSFFRSFSARAAIVGSAFCVATSATAAWSLKPVTAHAFFSGSKAPTPEPFRKNRVYFP